MMTIVRWIKKGLVAILYARGAKQFVKIKNDAN
jgi:hypothetical protein